MCSCGACVHVEEMFLFIYVPVMMLVKCLVQEGDVEHSVDVVSTGLQPEKQQRNGQQQIHIAILIQPKVHCCVVPVLYPAG